MVAIVVVVVGRKNGRPESAWRCWPPRSTSSSLLSRSFHLEKEKKEKKIMVIVPFDFSFTFLSSFGGGGGHFERLSLPIY